MQIVPLQAVPNQSVDVVLNGQACTILVYQKLANVFVDVLVNDAPIVTGIIALDQVLIVRKLYLGFIGDLGFIDTMQGGAAPQYAGLGTQFLLCYFLPSELG